MVSVTAPAVVRGLLGAPLLKDRLGIVCLLTLGVGMELDVNLVGC
jgi:hypothetical protein